MGAGSDLQIYHDAGGDSYIKELGTGQFYIQAQNFRLKSADGLESLITANVGGAVSLYYGNTNRLQTTNAGVDVTGDLVVTGTITGAGGSFLPLAGGTMTGNIVLNDNVKSIYGTASDGLEIFHDGTDSVIADTGTGILYIRGANSMRLQGINQSNFLIANQGGGVNLYYNNSNKLDTTNIGVNVTGSLSTSTDVIVGANATFVDNGQAQFGTGNDLRIFHDSANGRIQNATGSLLISGTEVQIRDHNTTELQATFTQDSGVDLYFDAVKRLETVTDGAKVTGNLEVTGTITGSGGSFLPLAGGTMTGNTIHNDNVKSIYGTASDGLEIYHDGTESYIKDTGTGNIVIQASDKIEFKGINGNNLLIANEGGNVSLWYNNAEKLATTSSGISVSGDGDFTGNVSVPDSAFLYAGTSDDLSLTHNGTDSIIRNYTGDFYINQGAVTQSIIFKVSDANALDTTALTISRNGDLTTGRDVTIAGDLTVNGTTTTVNSQTLAVVDPLIQLAKDNTANSLDIGLYGDYNDGTDRFLGLFSDASDGNKFKLFKGTTVEPTTTVNIGGAGYVAGDLVVAGLEASTGVFNGAGGNGQIDISRTSGANIRIQSQAALGRIGTSTNHPFLLFTNDATRLTIDTSGNSLFTGNVEAALYKIAGTTILSGASSVVVGSGGGTGAVTLRTTGGDVLVVDSSANTTLAGNLSLTSGSITIDDDDPYGGLFIEGGNAPGITIIDETLSTCKAGIFQQSTTGNEGRLLILSDIDNTGANSTIEMSVDGSNALVLDSSQNATFSGNINLAATKQLFFDGGGNTYITEDSADRLRFFTGGAEFMRFTESTTNLTDFYTNINAASQLQLIQSGTLSPELKFNNGTVIAGIDYSDTANLRFIDRTNSRESVVFNLDSGLITARNSSDTIKTQINQAGDSYFNGGNVGIGTDLPLGKLHVSTGTDDNDGNIEFFIGGTNSGNARTGKIIKNTSSPYEMTIRASNFVDGNNLILNDNGGNVGINEDTPLVPLHISRDSASGENIALILDNNDSTVGAEIGMLFRCNTNNTNSDYEIFAKSNGSNDSALVFQSDGSVETFRINKNGSQEWNMSNADISISGSTGGDVTMNNTTGTWAFRADGSSVNSAVISSSLVTLNEDTDVNGQLVASHGANYVARFVNTATSMSNNNYTFEVDSSSHTSNMSVSGAMAVDVNSGRAFTITGAGDTGVGINVPAGRLHVSNSATLTAVYQKFTNGTTGHTSNDGTTIGIDSDGDFILNNNEDKEVKIYTNDTQRLTVLNDGKIDIAGKDLIIDDVNEHREDFIATGNQVVNFDIDMKNVSASGQIFEVFVGFTHYADTYGASLHQAFFQRSTVQSDITLIHTYFNQASTNAGAWSVSYVDATTIRVSKSAGTHASNGYGYLRVTQVKP
jgi:hypothetical protein